MLKKLIILLTVFAIENSINCAEAQNAHGISYITIRSKPIYAQVNFNPMFITPTTREDLANANFDGTCPICQESENDINMLFDISMFYKANCPSARIVPHIFHRDCILKWIRRGEFSARNCPVCRGEMVDSNAQNNTALRDASRNGHLETVRLLLDRGADVNARNYQGCTALMEAGMCGHLETVRLLLDRGADANARTNNGVAALMSASVSGNLETVRLLLDRGADINARDNFEYTALMYALQMGHQIIADLLIAHGAIE